MGIGLIALVVAGVVLVVYVVRGLSTPATHVVTGGQAAASVPAAGATQQAPVAAARAETPREIVQRRYAAGEIDRDEYLQKLADL